MPIGGETIGRAYVRILADGTGFEADAERQLRKAEPTFEKEGQRQSDAYMRGFNSGLPGPGDEVLESFEDALTTGRGRLDRIGQLLAGGLGEGFEDEVKRLFPDVGDRIITNLRDSLAKGDIGEVELINRLHNLRAEAARAYNDIANDNARAFNAMEESVKRYAEGLDNSGRSRGRFLRDIKAMVKALPDAVTNLDSFRATVTDMRQAVVNAAPRLTRFREQLAGTGETIGKAFGKGSRNDFLNFFGSFVANLTKASRVMSSFLKWPGLVGEQLSRMVSRFQASKDEIGIFRTLLSGLGKGTGGLVTAAVTAGVAVSVIAQGIGVFASAISLASGAVLALAGSLSFALVGGLVAVAGALVPFAAGLGVAALAITGLNKKNKDTKKNLKSLKDEWKELQGHAAKGMFGKDGGGLLNLKKVIEAVEPIVKSVSKALGGLLDDLGKTAETKGFNKLMEDLGAILAPMVTTLGKIAGNLGLGLARAFIILEPYITDFLGWMEDVSKAFADAGKDKGARGGSPLATFFDKAAGSAMRVMDLIEQVGGLIATVFSKGKSTGDNIITKLADSAEDLNKWLSDPANADTINQWFEDAEKFFGKLGEVGGALIDILDALDTPTNRMWLFTILDVTVDFLGWLADVLTQLDKINTALLTAGGEGLDSFEQRVEEVANGTAWDTLKDRVTEATDGTAWDAVKTRMAEAFDGTAFDTFKQRASEAGAGIQTFFEPLTTWFSDLGDKIGKSVQDGLDKAKERIGELPGEITKAWEKLPENIGIFIDKIKQPFIDLYNYLVGNSLIPDLVNEIVRLFTTLPGLILGALGNLAGIFATWVSGVPGAVSGVVSQVVAPFSGLAGKIITGAGDIASQFGTWISGLPGKAKANATSIAQSYTGLASKIIAGAGSISKAISDWVAGTPGRAKTNADSIAKAYSGLADKAIKNAGSLSNAVEDWGQKAIAAANRVADGIVDQFSGLNKRIVNEVGTVEIKVKIIIPDIPRPHVTAIVDVPKSATGGVFDGAQIRMIGEAGPEAVVPLNRSLAQVDPAVRALSAIAQGLPVPRNSGLEIDDGKDKDKAEMRVTIITPTEDPRAVAAEVFARFTAASYV